MTYQIVSLSVIFLFIVISVYERKEITITIKIKKNLLRPRLSFGARFGVPPLGGFDARPPEGGTPNQTASLQPNLGLNVFSQFSLACGEDFPVQGIAV